MLLDSPFQEIRALRFDDKGMIYVAALSGRHRRRGAIVDPTDVSPTAVAGQSRARRSPSVSAEITSIVDRRRVRRRGLDRDRRARIAARQRARVYRIAPDGVWDQLWESRDDSPYDLDVRRAAAR